MGSWRLLGSDMRYPASFLRTVTNNDNATELLATYMDTIHGMMYERAEAREDHISLPCNAQTPPISDVPASLHADGYSADVSRSGIHGQLWLNIGWGSGYVIGGDRPLLN